MMDTQLISQLASINDDDRVYVVRMLRICHRTRDNDVKDEVIRYHYDKNEAMKLIYDNINYRVDELLELYFEIYNQRGTRTRSVQIYKRGD